MKVFKTFDDIRSHNEKVILDEYLSITEEIDRRDTLMLTLGGDWFLVENTEDLKQIVEGPYDIIEWKEDLLMVVAINNNSGGPAYFIPRDIVTGSLFEHLETTA